MRRLYVMCNGGHLFTTRHCPSDGWTAPALAALVDAAAALAGEGKEPTLAELRARGLGEDVLRHAVIVEFADPDRAFELAQLE